MKDPIDYFGVAGLAMLGAGVGARWGWPMGLIVSGAVVLLAYAYVEIVLPVRGRRRG